MMSKFHIKRLGDVVELIVDNRGRNPKSYEEEGIPIIDNYLITSDGKARLSEVKRFIDDETYDSFLRKYIQEGDVLMTLVGNGYGKVATTPKEKCAIIQNTIGLRCDEHNDNQYLYYLLRSNRESLMNLNRGAAQPSIKVGDVLDLEFQFPSLDEQRRISEILKSIEEKIELNRQTNQTLEEMAQAVFKSWFVDFEPTRAKLKAKENGQDPERAAMAAIAGKTLGELDTLSPEHDAHGSTNAKGAGRAGAALDTLKSTAALFPDTLVDSELGEIPEGWGVGTLNDLCDLNKFSWTKKSAPSKVLYVDLANTKNGVIEDVQYYSWEDAPSRAKRILNAGDVIIGTVRPGNRSFALIGDTQEQLTASTGFAVLSPKQTEYIEFLYIAAVSDENIDRLAHLADGGAYPAVRPDVVTAMDIALPPSIIIGRFSEIVSVLFKKRNSNLNSEKVLEETRDTLLPKLLSGEIDIPSNKQAVA